MAAKYLECSPKRRLHFEKLSGKTGDEKCLKTVLDHHFNFSVSIGYPFILFGSTERTQDEIMFFSSGGFVGADIFQAQAVAEYLFAALV